MRKRVVSVLLIACMLLSMLPSVAFAQEAEEAPVQSLTLPVVLEDEEVPEPQGYGTSNSGGTSLFSLVPNEEDYVYAYEGAHYAYLSPRDYFTFPVPEGTTPTSDGVLQIVDIDGTVLAGSSPVAYHKDTKTGTQWYFSSVYFGSHYDDADIPAGEYVLQIAVGTERYAVDQKLCVVDGDSLLISEADIELYYDDQTAEVYLEIYGLKSEEDLEKMSLILTDETGDVVARSTGSHRDFRNNNSYGFWSFYMELSVEPEKQLQDGMVYNLTISSTSERALVDGVGGVKSYAYKHGNTELGDIYFVDAQKGVLAVELRYAKTGENYNVKIAEKYDEDVVYGNWRGIMPEDGVLTIPLTLDGQTVPAGNYPSIFRVIWESEADSDYADGENPYNYDYSSGSSGYWDFAPGEMSCLTKELPFEFSVGDTGVYQGDGIDVLSMCDQDGVQVASCTSFVEGFARESLSGTLIVTGELEEEGYYPLFFNEQSIGSVRVHTSFYFLSQWLPNYSGYDMWTNFGEFPVSVEIINSSGTARFELQDGLGNVCLSTGELTPEKTAHGNSYYTASFLQEDLALYADRKLYLNVVDGTNSRRLKSNLCYDGTVTDVVFNSNLYDAEDNVYILWKSLVPKDDEVTFTIYSSMRNVSEETWLKRLRDLRLVCGRTTLTVDGMILGIRGEENKLSLSAPITAGDWVVYDGDTKLFEFEVVDPSLDHGFTDEACYIGVDRLCTNSAYTAKIYRDYTCFTEEALELRLHTQGGYDQYLYWSKDAFPALPRGEYEFRVYQDGVLIGTSTLIVNDLQPSVFLWEEEQIIQGGSVGFGVSEPHDWKFFRAAECEEALNDVGWTKLSGGRNDYTLTDAETVEERILYVQLSEDEDAVGTTVSEVVQLPYLNLGEDGLIEVSVHKEVEGFYSGDTATISLGANYPFAYAIANLKTADRDAFVHLDYQGVGELRGLTEEQEIIGSAHPYEDNTDETWSYTLPGAERIKVTFSEKTRVDSYDAMIFVSYVENGEEILWDTYRSDSLAGRTLTLPGDTVKVRLQGGENEYDHYGIGVTYVTDPDAEPEAGSTYHIYSAQVDTNDYFGLCEASFYLVEEEGDYSNRNTLISNVVERSLVFGDPTSVILPAFSYGGNTVSIDEDYYTLDGYGLPNSTVTLTYPDANGETVVWGTATADAGGKFYIELTNLEDGIYEFTATSETESSTVYGHGTLEVDTTPPTITDLEFAFSDSYTATLRWTCKDEDIYRFQIYLEEGDDEKYLQTVYYYSGLDGEFSLTVTASKNDGKRFEIVAFDGIGNYSSRTISTSDEEAPAAPGELTYTDLTATSVTLNWTAGTDDVGVAGYNIYMDGEKIAETIGESVLSYEVTGLEPDTQYTFRVETRDLAGHTSPAPNPELTIYTVTLSVIGDVTFIVKDTKTNEVIPGASVVAYQDGKPVISGASNAEGKAELDLDDGSYSLLAQATGYQPRRIPNVTITEDNREFTIYMNTEDIIQAETTVTELDYDQIIEAGIDPNAAGNQHVYECTVILDFMPVPIRYYCNDDGVVKGEPVDTGDGHVIYPVARDIFLIVPTRTTWLKEMFDVRLLVTNSSAFEDVENCVANLTLPEGLSLAAMDDSAQAVSVDLGTITPNGCAVHHWYICGDAEGAYTLQGNVTGTRVGGGLSEDMTVGFKTQEPITVLAGSAMKLTIEAEKMVVIGQPYKMRFTLANVSEKTLYNVNFEVLGGTFLQAYTIEEVLATYELEGPFKPDADNSELTNGFTLSAEEFKPEDVLSGVFTITFGQGIDDPDALVYMLRQVFLFVGAGSTTVIPTEVIWVDSIFEHQYDDGVVTKEATCTEAGEKTYTCVDSACGETYTEEIPATGHNMSKCVTVVAATCTQEGHYIISCVNPGCTYEEEWYVRAIGHFYAEELTVDLEPTCTEEGSASYHCVRPGCDARTGVEVIPAKGHSYGDWEKHNKEQHKHICTVETCRFEEFADHVWNDGEVTTAPTHLTEGVKTYTCTVCDETKTESVDKLAGHSWGEWEKYNETQHKRSCICGSSETADHIWNEGEVATEPTHVAEGVNTYTCTVCGETKTETVGKLTGHTWGEWKKISDTHHERSCACGSSETAEHNWSGWTTTTADTCADAGEERRDCNDCEAYETKTIPAGEHSWDEGVVTKEPTEYEEGVITYTCTICGATKTETMSKLQEQDMYFASNLLGRDMVKTYGDPGFTDMVFNESVEDPVLTYTSSDESVAIVDASGFVTIKGAGTAVISATSAAVPHQYLETTASYKLIVNKASLTVRANNASLVYGEAFTPNGYTITGFVYGETEDVLSGEIQYVCGYDQYDTVGVYPIVVDGLDSNNYAITYVSGSLTVSKATDYTITFDNLTQKSNAISAVIAQIVPQDATAVIRMEYKVNGSWTTALPTQIGDYPVRAQLMESTNIVLDGKVYGAQLIIEAQDNIGGVPVVVVTEDDAASVDVTDEEVDEIIDKLENSDGNLTMDLESVDKDKLILPGNLIEELDRCDNLETVTIETEHTSISMSDTVMKTMADSMDREDSITLQMNPKDTEDLDQEQKDALESIGGSSPNTVIVELKLTVTNPDGDVKSEIKELGDKVDITITCNQQMQGKRVVACYISPDGTVTYLVGKYDEATNTLNFKTDHFSIYAAVELEDGVNVVYVVDEDGIGMVATGAGPQRVGVSVTIEATDAPTGYRFSNWEVVEGGVTLENADSASTTFTMPDEDVVVMAVYSKKNSGSQYPIGGHKPVGKLPETEKEMSTNPFKDVTKGAYYYDAVMWAVENGITSGTSASTFSPDQACTRAQAITFLWHAAGSPAPKKTVMPFSDVAENAYYYEAVLWAMENDITAGTSETTFNPDITCSRAQIMTFLWRAKGEPAARNENVFHDVADDTYYAKAVIWASENGITTGTSANTFSPDQKCTRAQIVAFLWRSSK